VRVEAPASGTQSQAVPDKTPPKFLKGVVKAVDCSSPPIAILTVVAGTKSWHMQVPDSKHVLLIGADDFSCSWDHQRVALNYRPTGDFVGNVISIEVQ
jgi:hypothetical protein